MNTPVPIRDQLAAAGRARDRAVRLATALTVVGLIVAILLAVAAIDYGVILPESVRWGSAVVILLVLIFGAVRLLWLQRKTTSLKQSALEVEATRPDVGCEVSTSAEYLTGERKASQEYERELVAALQRRAANAVAQTPMPHGRRLLWPGLALLTVIIALGAFWIAIPAAGTALKRTAAPWTKAVFSHVSVTPGSTEIPVGRRLEIVGTFTGRQPQRAELHIREPNRANWSTVPLIASTNGGFHHVLPSVSDSFTYRVVGLDAVSDEFQVTSYVPPEVKDLRVQLTLPAYTKLQAIEQASANITVVRGSTAAFHLLPTVELSRAQLRFTNGTVLELKPSGSGWATKFPVISDTEYRFELFDAKGRRGGDEQVHQITAVPDAPPEVELAVPGQDIRASATNRIPLKVTASDDFGVAEVKIVYHRLGSPEQELVAQVTVGNGGEVNAEAELDLSSLKLREFELVAYHAEARDNNTLDGPGIGRSPTYFIEITDLEGGQCLSQSQGQRVNLLVIQKQIIADTAALPATGATNQFGELAQRQKDAIEFGRMYQQALTKTRAALTAQGAMNSAVAAMEKAAARLTARERDAALPHEESALANLYQVVGLMPELQSLPTRPPPPTPQSPTNAPALQVVLEAIKKQKKEEPNQQELAKLLEQVQQLRQQQLGLNAAAQSSGNNPSGTSPQQDEKTANESKQQDEKRLANNRSRSAQSQKSQQKQSKGQSPGQGKNPGNNPNGTSPNEGKNPDADSNSEEHPELAKLAPKQEQLSEEAKKLSERINRVAGKGSRRGHGAGQKMGEAAAKMTQAAQAMRSGQGQTAGTVGDQSASSLGAAEALLESLISGKPELTDVSAEDAPKQYESIIADYFKRLSHAE